eukprot:6745957-Pyramimonas_sp.AAC.1
MKKGRSRRIRGRRQKRADEDESRAMTVRWHGEVRMPASFEPPSQPKAVRVLFAQSRSSFPLDGHVRFACKASLCSSLDGGQTRDDCRCRFCAVESRATCAVQHPNFSCNTMRAKKNDEPPRGTHRGPPNWNTEVYERYVPQHRAQTPDFSNASAIPGLQREAHIG